MTGSGLRVAVCVAAPLVAARPPIASIATATIAIADHTRRPTGTSWQTNRRHLYPGRARAKAFTGRSAPSAGRNRQTRADCAKQQLCSWGDHAAGCDGVVRAFARDWSAGGAAGDFLAKTAKLSFPAGVATKFISVKVYGDQVPEPDETVPVTLSSPVNATI